MDSLPNMVSSNNSFFSEKLRDVLGRIWAFWGLIWFISSLLVVIIFYFPCFVLKEPAKAKWHRIVSQTWMRLYLFIIGCSIKTIGRENYQLSGNYVVVCNHNSLMDVPVSTPFLPKANKTIAKKSFTRIPLFGWVYSFGSVLVDRRSEESRRKSFDAMKHILEIGLDMLIYPEGTRNKTNQPLATFYSGAFRLAEVTGKPILPVLLFHTRKILPPGKFFYLWPHTIEMHMLPPESVKNRSANELKNILFTRMSEYYLQHNH
ncbi:MAG: lysophospholipid acyltransferase family protein [Bacteroidetes bacterium]|nr:lysophospholipid acyltransferase family protein [Bacteroidota bacterium]